MQIACKYRSLSRYRSKRSISLYTPRPRYVFFSRFRCTCPFLHSAPSVSLPLSLSPARRRSLSTEEKKSKPGQSKHEIMSTEFFLVRRAFVFNPSWKSSATESSTDIQFFDSLRYRRIYETADIADISICGQEKK